MTYKKYSLLTIAALLLPFLALPASAQLRTQQDDQRRLSPQERAMEALREQMQSTDDEWAVLQPRIQKVIDMKQGLLAIQGAALANVSGRRFRGGGDAGPAATEYRQSLDDIRRTILDSPAPAAIRRAIDAVREARQAAQQELASAQADLTALLTTEQEALLVQYGVLD